MLLHLIEDVERALEHECYFAALALALTLPDVCGKAAYPTEKRNWKRYKDWCHEFVSEKIPRDDPCVGDMPFMNEDILYSLRCSLLHQGNPRLKHCNLSTIPPKGAKGQAPKNGAEMKLCSEFKKQVAGLLNTLGAG